MGSCYNSVTINASVDTVWNALRNFHDLSWAQGVVTQLDIVSGANGNQIGAQRVINEAFHETLVSLNDLEHTLQYTIDDGPGPLSKDAVKNYVGSIRVSPVTMSSQSFVEWSSRFDSANPGAVGELCNPIYHALLSALNKHFS